MTIKELFKALGKASISLSAKCSINSKGELLLYGLIGDWWEGLDALSIVRELERLDGDEIVVRIFSEGGNVMEGLAMYNALKNSGKRIIVHNDGVAASMACAVAMAGDVVHTPSNALFMLHKPWAGTSGNANDFRSAAEELDAIEQSYLQLHANKTGKSVEEIAALIADGQNHFFRGQEAIDYGLADVLTDPVAVAASANFQSLGIPANLANGLFSNPVSQPAAAAAQRQPEHTMFKINAKTTGGSKWAAKILSALKAKHSDVEGAVADLSQHIGAQAEALLTGESEASDDQLKAMAKGLNVELETRQPEPSPAPATTSPDARGSIDAVAQERDRVKGLRQVVAQANLGDEHLTQWIDNGVLVADARAQALEVVAQRDATNLPGSTRVRTVTGDTTALRGAVANALLARAVPGKYKHTEASAEFRGMSFLETMKACIEAGGGSTRGKSFNDIMAMGFHHTSDFPGILADVANKELRRAYAERPRTFTQIGTQTTASDFKAKHSLQIGGGTGLKKVAENGEFKRGTVSESDESYKLDTYGVIYALSRQTIKNDDLGAFTRFIQNAGSQAARMESSIFWSLITSNPNMADGNAFFHSSHNNLASGSATIDGALSAMRALMRKQKGLDKEPLDLSPAFLAVGSDRETEGQKMLTAIQATTTGDVNVFSNSMSLVVEPRLDGFTNNPFYLFASPMDIACIEYAYLDGEEEPYLETREGFDVDGMEIKIRHDFGAGIVDHRGAVKNPGASGS